MAKFVATGLPVLVAALAVAVAPAVTLGSAVRYRRSIVFSAPAILVARFTAVIADAATVASELPAALVTALGAVPAALAIALTFLVAATAVNVGPVAMLATLVAMMALLAFVGFTLVVTAGGLMLSVGPRPMVA